MIGVGGQAARPLYEYFFAKVYADKTLGIERNARFMRPDSENKTIADSFDIDLTRPAGIYGTDRQDNKAGGYFETLDTNEVPLDSKPFVDETNGMKHNVNRTVPNKTDSGQTHKRSPTPDSIPASKKRGLLQRWFGSGRRSN